MDGIHVYTRNMEIVRVSISSILTDNPETIDSSTVGAANGSSNR